MITILTIAGSDSCGGAGIQADMKTIHRLGAHALCAITAVTAQNSRGVEAIYPIPAPFISKQIDAVVTDSPPVAVKLGMLQTREAVREVARLIEHHRLPNVVLDPVVRASTGEWLLDPEALDSFREELVPRVHVITPNLHEASALSGMGVETVEEAEEAARRLRALGPYVVVTGGHLPGRCIDVLIDETGLHRFSGSRVETACNHGTGCVFSSALASFLGMGAGLKDAVSRARKLVREALKYGYACGSGAGVVDPLGGVPGIRGATSGKDRKGPENGE